MSMQGYTGLQVSLGFFPLAFLLFFCTPRVEINGYVYPKPWGTHFFPLQPGAYHVTIYFPYLFAPRCGENSVLVNVHPGMVTRVNFDMPPWMFAKGSISVF